jgi:DNA repair protein RadC
VATIAPSNSEQIAAALLAEFQSLPNIWSQSPEALARVLHPWPSIIPLIVAARNAAIEAMQVGLSARQIEPFDPALRNYLIASMGSLPDERLRILFLDPSRHLISDEELHRGSLAQMAIYPRTIFRRALEHNAAALIVIHNHPSGDSTPSSADITATRRLDYIARMLEIELLDHMVVSAKDIHHILRSEGNGRSEKASTFSFKSDRRPSSRDIARIALTNARTTVRRRLLRRQLLGAEDLFGEPAWDMLLDLFIHECEGEPLSMFSMCATSGIPVSSAMRLAQKMCDAGLLDRVPDSADARRNLMKMRPETAHKLRAYFSEGVE